MRVWITKYALRFGVYVMDAEICDGTSGRMVRLLDETGYTWSYMHKPHWYETESEATNRVLAMIGAKIKSLTKTLREMESLEAEVRTHGLGAIQMPRRKEATQ
jgi:hypothetical protein